VNAGTGLTGGGASGEVTLAAVFGGDGTAAASARSDHAHVSTGAESVGIGPGALQASVGGQNTAQGFAALASTVGGGSNTAVGAHAASTGTSAAGNTAVGSSALRQNDIGQNHTAIGASALRAQQGAGDGTTAVGTSAAQLLVAGARNTAVGLSTLPDAQSGSFNVAVGAFAGLNLSTGTDNTFVGTGARAGQINMTNATALGARAQVDQNHSLVLGSIAGVNGATFDTLVGIGTTAPEATLDIVVAGGAAVRATRFGLTEGPRMFFRTARGTRTTPAAITTGDNLIFLHGTGHNGTGFPLTTRAFLVAEASENWTPTANGTRWTIATTPNGGTAEVERVRIDHDGEVGIGTTNPQDRLQVFGDVRVGTNGTTDLGCVKNFNAAAIAGICSSDLRFKRDITPFGATLENVAALRPVHYFWRAEAFPEKGFGPGETYGLIAQDVEAVLPELVTTDAQGYRAVDYSKLPLLAIQAIRELKERNDALERRLAALEALLSAVPGTQPRR
jgi:hypothetical protein